MLSKSWGALILASGLFLLGCGAARDPYGQKVKQVGTYTDRGDEWYNQGNLPRATKEFQRALDLSRGLDYQPGVARQLNNLGAVALEQGDLAQARQFFTRAWEINRNQENWAEASTNQANLATVAEQAGERPAAARHLSQAEEAARQSGAKEALGRIFCRWAGFFLDQQDFAQTEEYLELAQPLAKTGALKAALAHQRGRLALALRDAPLAITHFTRALEGDRAALDRAAMAADLYYLGEASALRRDWSQAFDYYARAFDVYASLGRQARLKDCLARLKEADREGALNRPLESFEKRLPAS